MIEGSAQGRVGELVRSATPQYGTVRTNGGHDPPIGGCSWGDKLAVLIMIRSFLHVSVDSPVPLLILMHQMTLMTANPLPIIPNHSYITMAATAASPAL